MDQQGSPPDRPSRQRAGVRADQQARPADSPDGPSHRPGPGSDGWSLYDQDGGAEADLPPWAAPAGYPARPRGARRAARQHTDQRARSGGGGQRHPDAWRDDAGAWQDDAGRDESPGSWQDPPGSWQDDQAAWPDYRDGGPEAQREAGPESGADSASRQRGASRHGLDATAQPVGGRAATARARRSRRSRRWLLGGVGLAAALGLLTYGAIELFSGQQPAASTDGYVGTFQPGEFRTVPNACTIASPATLRTFLPGSTTKANPVQGAAGPYVAAQSQCTFTLDAGSLFRVLQVSVTAYGPSPEATGDGSATNDATDAYRAELRGMRHPGRGDPHARLAAAAGLGASAFSALQAFHAGGSVSEIATVVARDRNGLIVVTMQGPRTGRGLRPVPVATLRAGALAVAREALAKLG